MMTLSLSNLLVFSLAACMVTAAIAAAEASEPIEVTDLTVESAPHPLGLGETQPRFGWIATSRERGQRQTAYRILVASTADLLARDKGDVWDSGRVDSPESVAAPHGGPALRSRTRYWWKVRVWDADGRPSAWSQPDWWEMGLLSPADWRAKWIAGPTAAPGKATPAPLLRRLFTLDKRVVSARLYISAGGYYEATLNGRRVGQQRLDPAYTSFNKRTQYVTHDVTSLLKPGANAIGVTLGRGWFGLTTPNTWNSHKAPWHGDPRLLAQLEVTYSDGTTTTITSDESWKTHDSPTIADSIYGGETYDARLAIPGWDQPGYDAGSWQSARVVEAPTSVVVAQAHEPITVQRTLSADRITHPKPGVSVFHFPVNIAGWARLSVQGASGTKVTLRYGERLRPDGAVDNANDLVYADSQRDDFILNGSGTEIFEPRFSYKGFQYVQVDGFPGEPGLDAVTAISMHTDVKSIGSFSCSNATLNALHQMTRQSILNNLYGIPTDTPVYEKNGWMGDAHLTAETALRNFDMRRIYAKWAQDIEDCQNKAGLVPIIAPNYGWGMADAPEWGAAFVLIPWYVYQDTGDTRILERHYPALRRYVDYLAAQTRDAAPPSCLGDWLAPGQGGNPPEGPQVSATVYVYQDLALMARIAQTLGHADDADRYAKLASGVKALLNNLCLDRANGDYHTNQPSGYRQASNVLPLALGLVPDDVRPAVFENLMADIHKKSDHLDVGILGAKYLLPLLTENGQVDTALKVAIQPTYPGWGYWVAEGSTTLWEAWGKDSRSLGHHMFGSIEDWFFRDLAGLEPAAPGWKTIRVKPYIPSGLKWLKASVDTVRGMAAAGWRRSADGTLAVDVTVPVGSTAEVHIPTSSANAVTEGGRPAGESPHVQFVREADGRAVFNVDSGEYHFITRVTKPAK